jgi:hypothetical protein
MLRLLEHFGEMPETRIENDEKLASPSFARFQTLFIFPWW